LPGPGSTRRANPFDSSKGRAMHSRMLNLVRKVAVHTLMLPVRFYRYFISPWRPPACRFTPTCSAYAEEALRVHGPVRGVGLAVRRICRCHPFAAGGMDPVPAAGEPGASVLRQALRQCFGPGHD